MSPTESVLIFGNPHFTCDYSNHIEMVIRWEEGSGGAVHHQTGITRGDAWGVAVPVFGDGMFVYPGDNLGVPFFYILF